MLTQLPQLTKAIEELSGLLESSTAPVELSTATAQILRVLKENPEQVTILSEEQIGTIVSGGHHVSPPKPEKMVKATKAAKEKVAVAGALDVLNNLLL